MTTDTLSRGFRLVDSLPPPSSPLLPLGKGWQSSSSSSGYIRVTSLDHPCPFHLSILKVRVTWRNDLVLNVLAGRVSVRCATETRRACFEIDFQTYDNVRFVDGFRFFFFSMRTWMQSCPTLLDSPMKKRNNYPPTFLSSPTDFPTWRARWIIY